MAVRIQLRRDTAANWTSNNPTLREGEIGIETDTLKMKVGTGSHTWAQITNYANVVPTNLNTTLNGYVEVGDIGAESGVAGLDGLQNLLIPNDSIIFEGATDNGFETTLTVTDPTADRTITFPNATGTVALAENVAALSGATFTGNISVPTQITFEGATADSYETIISVIDPTSDRVITLPDLTGTVVLRDTVETITNKSISLGSNTVTSTLAQLNTAVSDADVASLSGTETLTNKTLTSPVINTPTGITKSDVGLANVDNTTDANKPISTATQTALDLKAPLANPTFTGTVTLPSGAVTSTMILDGTILNADINASAAIDWTKLGISSTVSSTEIGYVDGVTSAIQTQLDAKAPLASPTFTGTVNAAALTLSGDLIVNGTTTTLNSTTMSVDDKNIELGSVATPSDATADGGGITLKGTTDKTFNWVDATDAWTSSEHLNLVSGKSLYLNGTLLKDATETLTNKTLTSPKINEDVAVTATATELNILDGATLSTTELNYVDGVTSAIQTQLNNKQAVVANVSDTEIGYLDGVTSAIQTQLNNKQAVVANVSDTEIGYLDGVTSAIQTQLDAKLATSTASSTYQTIVSGVSDTEIGYLDGVTSAIQTQLDAKIAKSLVDAKGDILVGSADNTVARLGVGTNGYLLTANSSATNGVEWAAAPVSLPSQTGESGKYLTTDGTTASWGTLVVPITTGTATITGNTATTIDTNALSGFTSTEYMVSLKQGSKVRTSKVVVQTDGTSVDMTEFAITETGGTMTGVVVSAAVSSTNAVLQVTVTDAATTNVAVKFSEVKL